MYVNNIRFGGLPVKKLYLGKKLVWQCTSLLGDTESESSASAHFYMTVIAELIGEAKNKFNSDVFAASPKSSIMLGNSASTFNDNTIASILQITMLIGDSNSKIKTDAKGMLIQPDYIAGDVKSVSSDNVIGYVLEAILSAGLANSKSDNTSKNNLIDAIIMKSDGVSKVDIGAAGCSVNTMIYAGGNVIIGSDTDVIGHIANAMQVGGSTTSSVTTRAFVGCTMPFELGASAESKSYSNTIGRTFNVTYIGGGALTNSAGEAMLRLFDVIEMIGDEKHHSSIEAMCKLIDLIQMISETQSVSDSKALVELRKAVDSCGNSKDKTYAENFIQKYYIEPLVGLLKQETHNSAAAILEYPPIGDGVVLSESDGIDIDIDGDILEIRQAYQVIIDEENGILEVSGWQEKHF